MGRKQKSMKQRVELCKKGSAAAEEAVEGAGVKQRVGGKQ